MTRVIGALGIVVLVMIGFAAAQEKSDVPPSVEETPPSWVEGPFLTGDWGGFRTRLAERGVTPYATYQAVITPFLTLQPDLQLVLDANQSRRDAVVFGVRLTAAF